MHHRDRIFGPSLPEHRTQLVVEGRNLLRCEARADAGARANPAAPCLVRVDRVNVKRKRFDISESGDREIARPIRIDSASATKLPFRIVFLNQLLSRLDHVARQRNPIEMSDHQSPARKEQPPRLGCSAWTIEPMP